MLTEFHGGPVAGGTFPAQIWKSFMQPALKPLGAQPERLPGAAVALGRRASASRIATAASSSTTDAAATSRLLVYFTAAARAKTANCKLNEVDVPNVVGWRVSAARVRLAAQPLTPQVIYKPAKPGQRVDIVVRQFPSTGTLSSFGRVTIVLAKPLHGTVPKIVGLRWWKASPKLQPS